MRKGVIKGKITPAIIGIAGISLGIVVLNRLGIISWRSPAPSDDSPVVIPSVPSPVASVAPSTAPTPTPSVSASPTPSPNISATPPSPSPRLQGRLRVSNQTEHPLRVALLSQQISAESENPTTEPIRSDGTYKEPVHWDFAPEEGSIKGLILSLPDSTLQLHEGDIVVAFAQDGSRRYWGPYVVGKTALPTWNDETQEWQLILTP